MVIGTPTWLLLGDGAKFAAAHAAADAALDGPASTAIPPAAPHRRAVYAANALALAAAAAAAADGVPGLRPSARRKLPTADDEAWLKHVWRMKPHWSPKEVSSASWAFLSSGDLRGIVSRGDPVRLQCSPRSSAAARRG